MYADLKGKTAIVTGAGKRTGIGFAIAEALAASGANLIIADLGATGNTDKAEGPIKTGSVTEMAEIAQHLEKHHQVQAHAVSVDVTRTESVQEMTAEIQNLFPKVDILCNNAGASFGVPNAVHTYPEADWVRTIDVNLHGVFRVSQALVPLMKGGSSIINTASRAGKVPALFNGAYAVAKAGVIMLTKVMAKELAGSGIRVNAVCPGQIMTDLEKWRFDLEAQFLGGTAEDRAAEMCKTIPLGRIGDPAEVGRVVAFLASSVASYMTGQSINVTGGQLMEL